MDRHHAARLRMIATAAVVAITAQSYRNAHTVVAPDLMRELGASAEALGTLGGALFFASAATQIPNGVLLDRYGPRRVMALLLLVGVAGALTFALSTSVGGLVVARALMGFGISVLGMASIVVCSRWFAPQQFALVAGFVIGASHFGNIVATAPMAYLAQALGWRGAYLGLAAFTLLLSAAVFAIMRDAPPGHPFHARPAEPLAAVAGGVLDVLRIPGFLRLLPIAATGYASLSCVIGLWGGPYLSDIHGLGIVARGHLLFWLAAGLVAGNFFFTALDRGRIGTKRLIAIGAGATATTFFLLAALPSPPLALVGVLFALLGFATGHIVLIIVHGRRFYPEHLVGRGITVVNAAVLGGAALLQTLTGLMVGALAERGSPVADPVYRAVFATLGLALCVALAVYRRCPERA